MRVAILLSTIVVLTACGGGGGVGEETLLQRVQAAGSNVGQAMELTCAPNPVADLGNIDDHETSRYRMWVTCAFDRSRYVLTFDGVTSRVLDVQKEQP